MISFICWGQEGVKGIRGLPVHVSAEDFDSALMKFSGQNTKSSVLVAVDPEGNKRIQPRAWLRQAVT
jgi:hypothetical protein